MEIIDLKKLTLLILILIVFVSGCTYLSNTPSEAVISFEKSYNYGDYNTSYSLMSRDYRDTHTIDDLKNADNIGNDLYRYKFIRIVEGSENIQNNTASVEFEYEKYAEPRGFLIELASSALNQESLFTKRIELVNETTGWKLKTIHKEMIKSD